MNKFKNQEELEKAYKELEKEFTKKSQKLAVYERQKQEKKPLITIVESYKPYKLPKLDEMSTLNISVYETIITEIVEAKDKREFECVCEKIRKFILDNNIDLCFVIDKDELIDCLQEHQKLKLQLINMEQEQIKEMQEHQDAMKLADKTIKELEAKLAESESKAYTLESYNNFLNNQCKKLIKENNQDKISLAVEQLKKVLPSIKATIELAENRHQMKDQVDIIIDNQIKELKEKNDD